MPAKKNNATAVASKFDALRKKAIDSGLASEIKVNDEPYVIGEDYGFTEPLTVPVPSLETTLIMQKAFTSGDALDQSLTLFGDEVTTKLVKALDDQFNLEDSSVLLTGFLIEAIEHFWGAGAGEVAGGFTD